MLTITESFSSVWVRAWSKVSRSVAVTKAELLRLGRENWYAAQNLDTLLSPINIRITILNFRQNCQAGRILIFGIADGKGKHEHTTKTNKTEYLGNTTLNLFFTAQRKRNRHATYSTQT